MPFVLSVGVTVNVVPLQITALIGLTSGVGFTNTVTVNGAPFPQFPILGVTM